MSDWKNQITPISNKIKNQLHAKKIDDLEHVTRWVQEYDRDNSGFLDKYEFGQLLAKIGIFLTTQEFRCIYNQYDTNGDGQIAFSEFIQLIRTQMSEKRLTVVKHAFTFLNTEQSDRIPLKELFSKFDANKHPRVKSKQKTIEQVRTEFEAAISKKSQDGTNITEAEFLDYYADVNATLPNEKEEYFIGILLNTWNIISSEDYVSPERLADLEVILFEKIRQKTNSSEDEGKTLKAAFKYFDKEDIGVIDISQFKAALDKFGCMFSSKEIQALFNKYDKDRSSKLCFDEFCGLFATMGAATNNNVKPVFQTERQPPKETLQRMRQEIQDREDGPQFIEECFRKSDKNQNGSLDRDEFKWAIKEAGFHLTQTEFTNLFKYFDKHNNNSVLYNDFVNLILN